MKTIKLYSKNNYLKECESKVINVVENDRGIFIELDQSIFYPEGGGQSSDLGTIGNAKVIDVIEQGDTLLHQVDRKPVESVVNCYIDWSKRLDNMQQHCGEHILSGVIKKLYNGINKGFRMGEDHVTIDIDLPGITQEMLDQIEFDSNQAVYDNLPIHIHKVATLEQANQFDLRKKIMVDKDIQIVEIQGVDCVACCGSHPGITGDVGIIKLLKSEKYKGMTRIYFKCGHRALKDFKLKHNLISGLCQKYSAEPSNLLGRLQKEEEKYKALRERFNNVKKAINQSKILELQKTKNDGIIASYLQGFDADDLSAISKGLTEQGTAIVLLGSDLDLKVVLSHSGNLDVHCGKLFKEHIKVYHGRGGGGERMAQAVFTNTCDLKGFVDAIHKALTD
ncbi:MAG: alanyl-tRNA editing protein [Desulfobacteraceae bacterium]|nr:alanyl-tRNA editing protein [Desulfobacteraceae bacterium]